MIVLKHPGWMEYGFGRENTERTEGLWSLGPGDKEETGPCRVEE